MSNKLIVVAALLLTTAAGPAKTNHRVTVDGVTYRVTVEAGNVEVARKTAFVKSDMATRDAMRAAVMSATGCKVTDEMPFVAGRLRGKLAC